MKLSKLVIGVVAQAVTPGCFGQVHWIKVDSFFGDLPPSMHIYKTTDSVDGRPNIAYYAEARLADKQLFFSVDTSYKRRLSLRQFYEKNRHPLLVVNGTFFSFQTSQNLNAVVRRGRLIAYNVHSIPAKGKDTLTYLHPLGSAIGINKKRKADVAWLYTDSSRRRPYAVQHAVNPGRDSLSYLSYDSVNRSVSLMAQRETTRHLTKWKMQSAIGGGPVLLQQGQIRITNNEELKFAGKALYDKHPRTAIGYTRDGRLIILVVQGRFPGMADGLNLQQEAKMLQDIGCWEALNLDGGGSSCMLINGKSTIQVSDKEGQRAVPAVFIVHK
jgi:Phosphodiester glycosidase